MEINDIPLLHEIESSYRDMRMSGLGRDATVETLCKEYNKEINVGREDDGILFWVALADAQYACKEISVEIAALGLNSLEALKSQNMIDARSIDLRKLHYSEAPMHERKIQQKKSKYRCPWKIGDTFAYEITSNFAATEGISGSHMLLRKVDEIEFGDGRLLPVVTLSMWNKPIFPKTSEEYQSVPLLRMERGRLGTPSDKYEYRAEIVIKSEKQLSKLALKYIGNFPNVKLPDDEIIFSDAGNMMMIIPETFANDSCTFWKMHQFYSAKDI